MKLRLKKIGRIMTPNDTASSALFGQLKEGSYNCTVAKARLDSAPDEVRRTAQNQLYWQILTDLQDTQVNAVAGTSKEEWHRSFKFDFLAPIYIRDCQSYALMFSALETVLNSLGRAVYENLLDGIVDETSTTKATVAQFSEYLNAIIQHCHGLGVVLVIDPEIFKLACGYQKRRKNDGN